ncbi:MAG: GlyGly-CTERM sorting domain-containing protein [Myxococcales bacterium]|nr:GlyGly-CTERM sorting domain-containing protein [Myxococcales bacterium]
MACLDCEDEGCDCDATDGGPADGLALLALALWGLRRRYSKR